MTAHALGIRKPEGGTFVFFDVGAQLREGEDTIGLLERCLAEGVLLTPGAASGRDYGAWVRLCFTSVPPDDLAEALARIAPIVGRKPT